MIAATLLSFSLVLVQSPLAEDYFPLKPGTKWEYSEDNKFSKKSYVDTVLEPVEIASQLAYPIQTTENGQPLEKVYYRASGDTVFIVAYDKEKPLPSPRPLFKVGTGKSNWEYRGTTPFYEDLVPLEVKGSASAKGRRTAIGLTVDCIEVKFEAQLMAAPGMVLKSNQTAIYGKGIGLLEMTEKTTVDRKSEERKLKLVSFTPAP